MIAERLPQIVLAQSLVEVTDEIVGLRKEEKRMLLCRYAAILRSVCKAAEEAYEKGFDDGCRFQKTTISY